MREMGSKLGLRLERTAHLREFGPKGHREAAVESSGGAPQSIRVLHFGRVWCRKQRAPAPVLKRQRVHERFELLAQLLLVLLDLLQLVVAPVHCLQKEELAHIQYIHLI